MNALLVTMDVLFKNLPTCTAYSMVKPFPHVWIDNALNADFAARLQNDILEIPDSEFDRLSNPFEQKYVLRDKQNYPTHVRDLFCYLESDTFVKWLSSLTGCELKVDKDRNFNGVLVYGQGDCLDIHVDAAVHPRNGLKKHVTVGIYLSTKWKEEYGCELELWDGENAAQQHPRLHKCVTKIAPMFNRMVIFTNDDYSWHGNPEPAQCPQDAKRIFVTISYLSTYTDDFQNKRGKAFFIARPDDPPDAEKDMLRELRADPSHCKDIYRYNLTTKKRNDAPSSL